jgi:hypothetical protein
VYKALIPGISAVQMTDQVHGNLLLFPNPVSATSMLQFSIIKATDVTLEIIDPLGRTVARPLDGEFQEAGPHDIQLNASKLTPGIYLCRLSAGGVEQETKFVVER